MWHLSPGGGRAGGGGTVVRDHPPHCCSRRGTQGASAGGQRALPCRAPPHAASRLPFPAAPLARREPVLSRSTLTGAKPSGQRGVRLRLGTPAPQGSSAHGHRLPARVAQHPSGCLPPVPGKGEGDIQGPSGCTRPGTGQGSVGQGTDTQGCQEPAWGRALPWGAVPVPTEVALARGCSRTPRSPPLPPTRVCSLHRTRVFPGAHPQPPTHPPAAACRHAGTHHPPTHTACPRHAHPEQCTRTPRAVHTHALGRAHTRARAGVAPTHRLVAVGHARGNGDTLRSASRTPASVRWISHPGTNDHAGSAVDPPPPPPRTNNSHTHAEAQCGSRGDAVGTVALARSLRSRGAPTRCTQPLHPTAAHCPGLALRTNTRGVSRATPPPRVGVG